MNLKYKLQFARSANYVFCYVVCKQGNQGNLQALAGLVEIVLVMTHEHVQLFATSCVYMAATKLMIHLQELLRIFFLLSVQNCCHYY